MLEILAKTATITFLVVLAIYNMWPSLFYFFPRPLIAYRERRVLRATRKILLAERDRIRREATAAHRSY